MYPKLFIRFQGAPDWLRSRNPLLIMPLFTDAYKKPQKSPCTMKNGKGAEDEERAAGLWGFNHKIVLAVVLLELSAGLPLSDTRMVK